MTPPPSRWCRIFKWTGPLFSIFCLLISFASSNKQIVVGSHNLHSFKKTSAFHKQCIQNYGGIWFAQELWLPERRLSELSALDVQFVARSGMEDSLTGGIYNGRPHGGVSIAWSPDINHVIRPLINYRHKRIVCVELSAKPNPILLASIYMPFYDTSKRLDCLAESREAISMLEEILAGHPQHKFILGGDFNTNSPILHLLTISGGILSVNIILSAVMIISTTTTTTTTTVVFIPTFTIL